MPLHIALDCEMRFAQQHTKMLSNPHVYISHRTIERATARQGCNGDSLVRLFMRAKRLFKRLLKR